MRILHGLGLLAGVVLAAAGPANAQGMISVPNIRGIWSPVQGSGASYEVDGSKGKTTFELTVVGKESVNGKDGVWVEMGLNPNGMQMYAKNLVTVDGKTATINRTIVQLPGAPPMELPQNMAGMMARQSSAADIRQDAQLVGTEDVTTPAGTFSCQHYKTKDGDAWISTKVTPWGLVKAVDTDQSTVVLQKIISSATEHITGAPQPFDPSVFMRQRPGRQ